MLSRRALLAGLGGLGLAACDREPSPRAEPGRALAPVASAAPPPGPRQRTVEGTFVHELFPSGGDESSPVLVAIHGRGDDPARWIPEYRRFPRAAHVVLPRAFEPFSDGWSWFPYKPGASDAELAAFLDAAESKLWPSLAKIAGGRRMIVTGFSQGGMLSFVLASRHADRVSHAFPVSGACPAALLPAEGRPAAPVLAFHGTSDAVVTFERGRATVEALARTGHDAKLRVYPGVGHTITAEMHDELWKEIVRALG